MTHEHLEEVDYLRAFDRAGVNTKEDAPQADCPDDRKALPAEGFVEHRGLAAWCPGPHAVRLGADSSLVDKGDQTPFAEGFFLSAGHLWRFHFRIFSSSRSMARRVGRWQLKPIAESTLPTWPG